MSKKKILADVNNYYTEKIKQFGTTAQGVDWNSEESQHIRFKQLLQIVDQGGLPFSLLDFGCGFGSLYEFMKPFYPDFYYYGYDISLAMIESARTKYKESVRH